tara:strand:+ start:1560 stop:1757 length:198 start_codon:yes stop_codon:yes gene_type:complete
MNIKANYFCFMLIGLIAGMKLTGFLAFEGLESNTIEGYHCTPITKHIGIESAKKQVEAYQAKARG